MPTYSKDDFAGMEQALQQEAERQEMTKAELMEELMEKLLRASVPPENLGLSSLGGKPPSSRTLGGLAQTLGGLPNEKARGWESRIYAWLLEAVGPLAWPYIESVHLPLGVVQACTAGRMGDDSAQKQLALYGGIPVRWYGNSATVDDICIVRMKAAAPKQEANVAVFRIPESILAPMAADAVANKMIGTPRTGTISESK